MDYLINSKDFYLRESFVGGKSQLCFGIFCRYFKTERYYESFVIRTGLV